LSCGVYGLKICLSVHLARHIHAENRVFVLALISSESKSAMNNRVKLIHFSRPSVAAMFIALFFSIAAYGQSGSELAQQA
jgi:hypothetical protein